MMKRWSLPKTARSPLPLTMTILPHARAVPFVLLQRHPNTATSAAAHVVNSGILLSSVQTRNLLHRFTPCRLSLMTPPYAVTPPVSLSLLRTTAVAPPSTRTSSSSIARARSIFSPTLLTSTMFAQRHIPSKFTATRELCRPTMLPILAPTKYMSTKMASPTYSPSSC